MHAARIIYAEQSRRVVTRKVVDASSAPQDTIDLSNNVLGPRHDFEVENPELDTSPTFM